MSLMKTIARAKTQHNHYRGDPMGCYQNNGAAYMPKFQPKIKKKSKPKPFIKTAVSGDINVNQILKKIKS